MSPQIAPSYAPAALWCPGGDRHPRSSAALPLRPTGRPQGGRGPLLHRGQERVRALAQGPPHDGPRGRRVGHPGALPAAPRPVPGETGEPVRLPGAGPPPVVAPLHATRRARPWPRRPQRGAQRRPQRGPHASAGRLLPRCTRRLGRRHPAPLPAHPRQISQPRRTCIARSVNCVLTGKCASLIGFWCSH